jgi:hypothetical protein
MQHARSSTKIVKIKKNVRKPQSENIKQKAQTNSGMTKILQQSEKEF